MKLLNIFNQYLEPGGEAQAVGAICDSLSHINEIQRCDFLSADWVGENAPAVWKQALLMFRNPTSLNKIREQQHRFKSDAWLVHNVFPVGSAAIYSEAERLDVPIIQYIHNFRPFSVNGYLWAGHHLAPEGLKKNYWPEIFAGAWQNSRFKTAWLALILRTLHARNAFRSVKAWIAISDFIREKFIFAGIPTEKIFTLRHFWKPQHHFLDGNGRHYLYLGRLTEAKGVNVLLDAWQILEAQYGSSTPKLLIGGDGPLRSVVAARIERMQSVTYAGQLSDAVKAEALSEARAVVVPSLWWEALGLVVYEAYDYSRPVLVAHSGGLPEIVAHRETGLVHDVGNAAQLAEHVIELEVGVQRRKQMGRQGRAWLEANTAESAWRNRFCEVVKYATRANSPA